MTFHRDAAPLRGCRSHRRLARLYTCCLLILAAIAWTSPSAASDEFEVKGDLDWPEQWTVFAPLSKGDSLLDTATLRAIPERIEAPVTRDRSARTLEPQLRRVPAGQPADLTSLFKTTRAGNVAYIFLELNSPRAQAVTLGMGADWWLQVWVNGREVYDTLTQGNASHPPTVLDHHVNVSLREGSNVLAVRYITGRNNVLIALGGPDEIAAAKQRQAQQAPQHDLNTLPENFADRLVFPADRQAIAAADMRIEFDEPDGDLAQGALVGVTPMPARQIYLDGGVLRDTVQPRFDESVRLLLSKDRYPWEDRHLDAIVRTSPNESGEEPHGHLEMRLKDAAGQVLAHHEIDDLASPGLFFSLGFPESLQDSPASLDIRWMQGDRLVGQTEAPFRVNPPSDVPVSGRIELTVPNNTNATLAHTPMTVGVPFPRGALTDPSHVRLVDERGQEIPLQTRTTGRWSRFGSIKWLLCDFTVDLDGQPRTLFLQYGPDVSRTAQGPMTVEPGPRGLPAIDAGRIQVDANAVRVDVTGNGDYHNVLDSAALRGAFVQHEDGKRYIVPDDVRHTVEEHGSEKVVVRRTGWYVHEASGERFCQFVTRLIFHRNSPIMRVFHTWIFTGDGNRDRIANMGWRFPTAQSMQSKGLLSAFDNGQWLDENSLVQFDYKQYLLPSGDAPQDGRAPGVISAVVGDSRVTFGTRDFWQNFPSELEIEDDAFTFYNWPKHNPSASFDRPVEPEDVFRSRFAHEGKLLDFQLPEEYGDGEVWQAITRNKIPLEEHLAKGRIDTINAQGIAHTEEMYLHFADSSVSADETARIMQGLNDETLRAVVDPQWMTACGIYDDLHPRDMENFPEEERLYELAMAAPIQWVERLGFYGMWLHGDYATWNMNLPGQSVQAYRALRKSHHQFPYRWIPFVRSGEPKFLKLADNAARQMIDANFCHYATEAVNDAVGPDHYRRQGQWTNSFLPWAGAHGPDARSYTMDCDYLWDTYHITGNARLRDVTLLHAKLIQQDHIILRGGRHTQSLLSTCLDMYQATFDPWFLNTAHQVGALHQKRYADRETIDPLAIGDTVSMVGYEHWRQADDAFYRFTGREAYKQVARNGAMGHARPRAVINFAGAGGSGAGAHIHLAAQAWKYSDNPLYLGRLVAALDHLKITSYEGDIDYLQGVPYGTHAIAFNGVMRSVPKAMAVLADTDQWPEPVHDPVWYAFPHTESGDGYQYPDVSVQRRRDEPVMLTFAARGGGGARAPFSYDIVGPGGMSEAGEVVTPKEMNLAETSGTYRINLAGDLRMFFPLADRDVPEVMHFAPSAEGIEVPATPLGFWFMVPEGVESFWVRFTDRGGGRHPVVRASVWNPDGERVWDRSYAREDAPLDPVTINVPPGQDGKIWRITGGRFTLDPAIPPYFALSRAKWFNPSE